MFIRDTRHCHKRMATLHTSLPTAQQQRPTMVLIFQQQEAFERNLPLQAITSLATAFEGEAKVVLLTQTALSIC